MRDGVVSHSAAKQVFATMVKTGDRAGDIAEREGLLKVSDDAALIGWIDEVFAESSRRSGSDSSAANSACRACSSDT